MISIFDKFNKKKNNRFVDGFWEGDEYIPSIAYTEVVDSRLYTAMTNGVIGMYKPLENSLPDPSFDFKKGFRLEIPKLPHSFLLQTLAWYRSVALSYRTEACVLFYWNKDKLDIPKQLYEAHKDGLVIQDQFIMYCPIQYNTGTLSQFTEVSFNNGERIVKIPEMIQWLEANTTCIIETHSHHDMTAHWSEEDDLNEKSYPLRMFLVMGEISKERFAYKMRVNFLGDSYALDLKDVFNMPEYVNMKGTKTVTVNKEEYVDNILTVLTKTEQSRKEVSFVLDFEIPETVENYERLIREFKEEDYDYKIIRKVETKFPYEKDTLQEHFPESWWNHFTSDSNYPIYFTNKSKKDDVFEQVLYDSPSLDFDHDNNI